jgi:hypothetical protein
MSTLTQVPWRCGFRYSRAPDRRWQLTPPMYLAVTIMPAGEL